jgi:hypothetical protein
VNASLWDGEGRGKAALRRRLKKTGRMKETGRLKKLAMNTGGN